MILLKVCWVGQWCICANISTSQHNGMEMFKIRISLYGIQKRSEQKQYCSKSNGPQKHALRKELAFDRSCGFSWRDSSSWECDSSLCHFSTLPVTHWIGGWPGLSASLGVCVFLHDPSWISIDQGSVMNSQFRQNWLTLCSLYGALWYSYLM
jgi:hypothetical protein